MNNHECWCCSAEKKTGLLSHTLKIMAVDDLAIDICLGITKPDINTLVHVTLVAITGTTILVPFL